MYISYISSVLCDELLPELFFIQTDKEKQRRILKENFLIKISTEIPQVAKTDYNSNEEQIVEQIVAHAVTFLFTLAVVAARPSHFSSLEGHGLASEPKLISESVHLKEIPTKVIKVTKTAVVKVPVPYPVKVPHHIPVPVPVNHPIAVPYTKLVKVQEHVPIEVSKPVPVAIHQQIPIPVPKAVPVPQPIPVPHPVTVNKPVFYPVPHPFPYQASSHSEGGVDVGGYDHGDHLSHQSGKALIARATTSSRLRVPTKRSQTKQKLQNPLNGTPNRDHSERLYESTYLRQKVRILSNVETYQGPHDTGRPRKWFLSSPTGSRGSRSTASTVTQQRDAKKNKKKNTYAHVKEASMAGGGFSVEQKALERTGRAGLIGHPTTVQAVKRKISSRTRGQILLETKKLGQW
ncbi:hypothetical protein WN51_12838 [Melipona quadrifasciata]|uniref:Zinc finger protein 512B n=1 Tax=Melipona quadrifasciata TaxID=166423 RepID=A0A0N0BGW7_9HYME|nr:hypothetical protein WN51_12838 [Melipona quadrifasciata]